MEEWQDLETFRKITSYSKSQIAKLVKSGEIEAKNLNGELFLRQKQDMDYQILNQQHNASSFSQETLQKVLDIHSKLALAKDEAIAILKNENEFLKNTLLSMQEICLEDKKIIEHLCKENEAIKEEMQKTKRKYQIIWDKAKQKE